MLGEAVIATVAQVGAHAVAVLVVVAAHSGRVDGGRRGFVDAGVVDGVAPLRRELGIRERDGAAVTRVFTQECLPRIVDQIETSSAGRL